MVRWDDGAADGALTFNYDTLAAKEGGMASASGLALFLLDGQLTGRAAPTQSDKGEPHGSAPPTPPDMRVRIRRFRDLSL
jgi:hypothetical protein